MIHGDEFGPADWILMLLATPMVGAAVGLLVSVYRNRFMLAALVGAICGTSGAWLGVATYRWVMDAVIGGRDMAIFGGITIGCFLLGAILASWLSAGAKSADIRVNLMGCGLGFTSVLVMMVGVLLYSAASEPSAFIPMDASVKYIGIACIMGGAGTLAGRILWLRRK